MTPDQFPSEFKVRMIAAYPLISQLDADARYFANADELDAAFQRILDSRNLSTTCALYLADLTPTDTP